MQIACIIQARTNSTRLPNKINADIGGWPMIKHVTRRMETLAIPVIVAMPENYSVTEDDVLGRYFEAAAGIDIIVRVTGDCPLIDPFACRRVLDVLMDNDLEYAANDIYPTYPDGMGCEVFTFAALKRAHQIADKAYDREHVTPVMRRNKEFTKTNVMCPIYLPNPPKLSVDTQEDLDFVRRIDAAGAHDFSLEATLGAIERVKAQDLAQGT